MLSKINQILVFLFTIFFSSFTFSQTTCNDTSWDKGVDFNGANQLLNRHLDSVLQNPELLDYSFLKYHELF